MLQRTRPSTVQRPSVVLYAVVAFLSSFCANLVLSEAITGTWAVYAFGQVPVVLSLAFAPLFAGILALTRVFTGPQLALWMPAVLGAAASLVLSLGVVPDSSARVGPLTEMSWLTVSYLALPPLMSALWFEGWESVRLREARAAARAADGPAAR